MATFAVPIIPQFPGLPEESTLTPEEEEATYGILQESEGEESEEEEEPQLLGAPVPTPGPTTTLLGGVEPESIEDYLVQEDEESDTHFDQRATLAEAVMSAGGVEASEAVMLGRLLQNKYIYGVVYPEAIEKILAQILIKLQ
jgi:hypothetical protein